MTIDVDPAEYNRLLGYPRDWILEGRARELAQWARDWYSSHGRPWTCSRAAEPLEIDGDSIRIEDETFSSDRLHRMLREAEAHAAIVVAVSAGPELEQEAQKLWDSEKPDEYFFLETYGSAVVERLIANVRAKLCQWAEARGISVLPHYSPGYPDWEISQQARLLRLLRSVLPGSLEVLDSGALRPKKSLLAVFGLTKHISGPNPSANLIPCQTCSLSACDYRRDYSTNKKALKRWAAERLSIEHLADRSIHARFRYEGTTCTNMGRTLAFNYDVMLGPKEEGYPIREQRCSPAPGDTGHTYMCQYLKQPDTLMSAIECEKPLLGQPLNDILTWRRSATSTGCYCDPDGREHKWGLVLETIHYALQ